MKAASAVCFLQLTVYKRHPKKWLLWNHQQYFNNKPDYKLTQTSVPNKSVCILRRESFFYLETKSQNIQPVVMKEANFFLRSFQVRLKHFHPFGLLVLRENKRGWQNVANGTKI